MKIRKPRLSHIRVFTEPQKKGGRFSISCDPNFFYTVSQSLQYPTILFRCSPRKYYPTLYTCCPNTKLLFSMIGFHPIHQF